MKRQIIILLVLFASQILMGQVNCKTDITVKNDTAYENGTAEVFNGTYYEYYPGEFKVKGFYKDGLKDGEFIYLKNPEYGSKNYDSLVNYSNGLKNGFTIKYCKYHPDFMESKENFSNGKRDGVSYYWDNSGQIKRVATYQNNILLSEETFEVNKNIRSLSFIIENEEDGVLNKMDFNISDTIRIDVIGVTVKPNPVDSTPIFDIIELEGYTVQSFTWSGTAIKDLETNEHIDAISQSKSNYLTATMKGYILEFHTKEFWIEEVVIKDKYGFEYTLPPRRFEIINYEN